MLTAEPTGGVIWHACRGAITLRVRTFGREAHVGYAHEGVNAFEHMIRIAEPLTALSHELLDKRTRFPVESEAAAGSMLVVGGQAGAGAGFNAVPGSAWFSVDRRFNPEEELEQELARLTGDDRPRQPRPPAPRSRSTCCRSSPRAAPSRRIPPPRRWPDASARWKAPRRAFQMCPGVLDTRWYSQLGIPAFAYGGGRLDISHGPGEYIDEAAMRRCAAVYALFAEQAR